MLKLDKSGTKSYYVIVGGNINLTQAKEVSELFNHAILKDTALAKMRNELGLHEGAYVARIEFSE